MLRHVIFILSVLSLLVCEITQAASVRMENEIPVRWETTTIPYVVNPYNGPFLSEEQSINAIKSGFLQWSELECASLTFPFSGTTNSTAVTPLGYPSNGKNEVVWVQDASWPAGQFVLGITTVSSYLGGAIFEADIVFNASNQEWSSDGSPDTADILSVATHEAGHFIGVQHSLLWTDASDPPTMAVATDPDGKSRDLNQDDSIAACFLYADTYSCASNDECPFILDDGPFGEYYAGQITCIENTCGGITLTVPKGTKELGEACQSNLDCDGTDTFCQAISSTLSFCAKECANSENADCPDDLQCVGYANAAGGVCLPSSVTDSGAKKSLGAPCNGGNECESLLCISPSDNEAGFCVSECNLSSANPCNAGFQCIPLPGVAFGACLPSNEEQDGKYNGEPCLGPTECISGLCVGGIGFPGYFCRSKCSTDDAECPVDHECIPFDEASDDGACIPEKHFDQGLSLGEQCLSNKDCNCEICIEIEDAEGPGFPFCTAQCGTCPCGLVCTAFTGGKNWCIPGPKEACIPDDNPCAESTECISGFCFNGTCKSRCKVTSPDCAAGKACKRLTTNELNGVCIAPGEYSPGFPCDGDEQCSTLFCEPVGTSEPVCLKPCDHQSNAGICGEALICLPIKAGVGGCVLESSVDAATVARLRANAKEGSSGGGLYPNRTDELPVNRESNGQGASSQNSSGCSSIDSGETFQAPLLLLFCLWAFRKRTASQC